MRQRWEYKRIRADSRTDLITILNKLGEEGWELVGFRLDHGVYFKRPLASTKCAGCNAEVYGSDYLCSDCRK